MTGVRSYLGRHVAKDPATEDDMHKMRRKAWHSQGCVVCFPDDIPDEWLRQGLINWAESQYGKREDRT